jgi:hypothetical protein
MIRLLLMSCWLPLWLHTYCPRHTVLSCMFSCCWLSVVLLLSIFLCHTASNEPGQWSPLSLLAVLILLLQGGMVLVSHDFRLIDQVAKEIWVCEKQVGTRC